MPSEQAVFPGVIPTVVPAGAVYVDELIEWGWKNRGRAMGPSCHMFTDPGNEEALHAVAEKIGLKREWFQNHRTLPHYDLVASRRAAAVARGLVTQVDRLGLVERIRAYRGLSSSSVQTPKQKGSNE
jgi:hypothetical protein